MKWGLIIISIIIAMIYNIDKNHYLYSDLRWGEMIMPRIIVMISPVEVKSGLSGHTKWFNFQVTGQVYRSLFQKVVTYYQ